MGDYSEGQLKKVYAEAVHTFEKFFGVRKNLIFERARFNCRDQMEGESTEQYPFFALSVASHASNTSPASSPRQYKSVLTCFPSSSVERPDATRYCSKRLSHRGHSSGFRRSNCCGGTKRLSAIATPLPPCPIIECYLFTHAHTHKYNCK